MKNKKEQKIDELVSLIDQFMEQQGGHLNIYLDEKQEFQLEKIELERQVKDCQNNACFSPTLMQNLDDKEENNNECQ